MPHPYSYSYASTSACNVTLSSPVTQSLDMPLCAPPASALGRRQWDLKRSASESDNETLIGYEEAMKGAADEKTLNSLLNDEHLVQLQQRQRQEDIKASWLAKTGLDITDERRNGPMPRCTVDELISEIDSLFGPAPSSSPKRKNGAEKVSQQSSSRKSRKAAFVQKCRNVKWMQ